MDGAYIASGAISSIAGVSWLVGRTVQLRVDGVNVDDVVVGAASNGTVTVSPASTTSVQFGIGFTTEVKDLPVEVAAQNVRAQGSLGKKKRVYGATLRLKNTSGITVNGNTVVTPDYTAAGSNTAITDFTGIARVEGIYEYDETGQLTIAQAEPNPMTLLAISKKVNF
jgi:hypothetical protein